MHTFTIKNLDFIDKVAKEFLMRFSQQRIIAFYGKMGAGKTTFIQALCQQMGIDKKEVNSPTFALVNEYVLNRDERIYHFDFYRIRSISEVFDVGYEDYFYSGSHCFIEWPEKVEQILPEESLQVLIEEQNDGSRMITIP